MGNFNLSDSCCDHYIMKSNCVKHKSLTLFHMTLGHIDPDYHESACYYHIVRAKFTKIRDFVPFDICQDPVRLLLTFIKIYLKSLGVFKH